MIPSTTTHIHAGAAEFHPDENYVVTTDNKKVRTPHPAPRAGRRRLTPAGAAQIGYDHLIVATGMHIHAGKIAGLEEALEEGPVSTNYIPKYASKTFDLIKNFEGGEAVRAPPTPPVPGHVSLTPGRRPVAQLFTFPTGPMKCAGAPQKIMYLAEDYWRKKSRIREKCDVIYNTALPRIFGVVKYAESLRLVCQSRDINVNYSLDLVEVRNKSREAVFRGVVDGQPSGDEQVFKYDMMHVAPKMGPVKAVADSPLANAAGFVDVDDHTLQHKKYRNVWSLGDASSLPTSKTAAAISEESGVLKANLRAVMAGRVKPRRYNGYTSCPLVTGYGSLILAEFDYSGEPLETFPVEQSLERSDMYYLKRDVMPTLYWHGLLTGLWEGPGTFSKIPGVRAV